MEQRKIMDLLIRATNTRGNQLNHIGAALTDEISTILDNEDEDFGWHEGLRALLEALFFDALDYAPYWLPRLFPAFAYAAGDRDEGMQVAHIDWSIALEHLPAHRPVLEPQRLLDHDSGQAPIMRLLLEAVDPTCNSQRRDSIQAELTSMVVRGDTDEDIARRQAFTGLVSTVFVQALEHPPWALVYLFPIFAALCGPRKDGVILTEPDWQLALHL